MGFLLFRASSLTYGLVRFLAGAWASFHPLLFAVVSADLLVLSVSVALELASFEAVLAAAGGALIVPNLLREPARPIPLPFIEVVYGALVPCGRLPADLELAIPDPAPGPPLGPAGRLDEALLLDVRIGVDAASVSGVDAVLEVSGVAFSAASLCTVSARTSGIGLARSPVLATFFPVDLDALATVGL